MRLYVSSIPEQISTINCTTITKCLTLVNQLTNVMILFCYTLYRTSEETELEKYKSLNLLSDLLSQCSRDMIAVYNTLREAIDRQLKRNKFSCVNITGIFSGASSSAAMFGGVGSREDFDELGDLSDDTDKEI